jgi:hypothetical protein
VAFIIPDEELLTKGGKRHGSDLSYAELASLYDRAHAGDAASAIALAGLPEMERRLAESLVKTFGGKRKVKVVKAGKKKLSKEEKRRIAVSPRLSDAQRVDAQLARMLDSADPLERETARNVLRDRGVL